MFSTWVALTAVETVREVTALQIAHIERPAVLLYPQASRSLSTHSGYRLYRYPAMHLQCRVQLLAKSQHPIATLNSHSARSQIVGGPLSLLSRHLETP